MREVMPEKREEPLNLIRRFVHPFSALARRGAPFSERVNAATAYVLAATLFVFSLALVKDLALHIKVTTPWLVVESGDNPLPAAAIWGIALAALLGETSLCMWLHKEPAEKESPAALEPPTSADAPVLEAKVDDVGRAPKSAEARAPRRRPRDSHE